ncbi:hypothetical protein CICLE_v10023001mg [Citrus x clementina]|uniref:Uncharacterized protein n=3 Tax=Citrus TaxID=2706 RepID=A0ACB8MH12_CITSI|nr:hypothetical protein CICLE_v10023001mg [Citrus x clementina]KAH9784913.1 hypothetical protein KPL71_009803 [Citrus sinensis]KDO65907.1 hypothetical protein CISIN_1g034099mg [Citrus sinensis]
MAATKSETYTKSYSLLLFALVCFIFLLFQFSTTDPIKASPSKPDSSVTTTSTRFLLNSPSSTSTSTSTVNLHNPKRTPNTPSNGQQLGADEHEVPSGPNPISNR